MSLSLLTMDMLLQQYVHCYLSSTFLEIKKIRRRQMECHLSIYRERVTTAAGDLDRHILSEIREGIRGSCYAIVAHPPVQ